MRPAHHEDVSAINVGTCRQVLQSRIRVERALLPRMNGTVLEGTERPEPARAEAVYEQRDESPDGKALRPLAMASGELSARRVQAAASMQEDDSREAWRQLDARRRQKHLPSQ